MYEIRGEFKDSKSSRHRTTSSSWFPSTCRFKAGLMVPLVLAVVLLVMCVPERCLGKVGSDEKEDSSSAAVGESVEDDPELEMAEYLDDEVRFVTEDDFMYEEDRSHYSDFHQVSFPVFLSSVICLLFDTSSLQCDPDRLSVSPSPKSQEYDSGVNG